MAGRFSQYSSADHGTKCCATWNLVSLVEVRRAVVIVMPCPMRVIRLDKAVVILSVAYNSKTNVCNGGSTRERFYGETQVS